MANITYLIGAGASFHSIPVINRMKERMEMFHYFVQRLSHENPSNSNSYKIYLDDLKNLISQLNERTTIDSLAKKFDMGGKHLELTRLKRFLSDYLVFEQIEKDRKYLFGENPLKRDNENEDKQKEKENIEDILRRVDERYFDIFGKYHRPDQLGFPDHINVISWNYDIQFELAYSEITGKSIDLAESELFIYPVVKLASNQKKSLIIKLNGTAGLYSEIDRPMSTSWDFLKSGTKNIVDEFVDSYERNHKRNFNIPMLNFAWENTDMSKQAVSRATEVIEQTDVLVIIGYSFPDANREIDRRIFKNSGKIGQVYYQVHQDDYEHLKDNKLYAVNPRLAKACKPFKELNEFCIPTEH